VAGCAGRGDEPSVSIDIAKLLVSASRIKLSFFLFWKYEWGKIRIFVVLVRCSL